MVKTVVGPNRRVGGVRRTLPSQSEVWSHFAFFLLSLIDSMNKQRTVLLVLGLAWRPRSGQPADGRLVELNMRIVLSHRSTPLSRNLSNYFYE